MRYYFAPMEGLTDSVYRRLHHQYFGGVDRYYMPFLSPTIHRTLTPREERELPYADRENFEAVPQILTKVSADFLWAAEQCAQRGYKEVNLNLGCPSGTVVAKGKGSGMLRDLETLDRFLEEIFASAPLPISIKTRLGLENPEDFPTILEIYNRYPVAELTIHPRTRKQFYNGALHMELFDYALKNSKNPLCFNGELQAGSLYGFSHDYPGIDSVMIGRGLVSDPGMLLPGGTDRDALEQFHSALFEGYAIAFGNQRNAMTRLKENWHYLEQRFEGGEKLFKRLRKATDPQDFQATVKEIFHALPFVQTPTSPRHCDERSDVAIP